MTETETQGDSLTVPRRDIPRPLERDAEIETETQGDKYMRREKRQISGFPGRGTQLRDREEEGKEREGRKRQRVSEHSSAGRDTRKQVGDRMKQREAWGVPAPPGWLQGPGCGWRKRQQPGQGCRDQIRMVAKGRRGRKDIYTPPRGESQGGCPGSREQWVLDFSGSLMRQLMERVTEASPGRIWRVDKWNYCGGRF